MLREERKGVEGMQKMKDGTKTEFTMALDLDKEKTPRYSQGRRKFDNYVIAPDGKVAAIIAGSLVKRAKSEQLFEILEKLKSDK